MNVIYIYIYICVCVCVCRERERERERERGNFFKKENRDLFVEKESGRQFKKRKEIET